jgi:hypothetical protein
MGAFLGVAIGLAMLTIMGHQSAQLLAETQDRYCPVISGVGLACRWRQIPCSIIWGAPRLYPSQQHRTIADWPGIRAGGGGGVAPIYQQSMWRQKR